MPWLTHRVLRKEASFKLTPNEWFNLETKTGIRGWNSPKFVISVNKYLSTYGAVDARCEIIASTYPTFYLSNVERMGAGSEITVYVVEGNEDTIKYNPNAGWTETFRIKENTIYQYEINSGNNWTVLIPSNLIGKEFDILYLPKKVYFSKTTFGYEYQAIKNSNNTISFKLQETKGNIFSNMYRSNEYSFNISLSNVIYWYSVIYSTYSLMGDAGGDTLSWNLNGVLKSKFCPLYGGSEGRYYVGAGWILGSSQVYTNNINFNFSANFSKSKISINYYYATTSSYTKINNNEYECSVIFIKKGV